MAVMEMNTCAHGMNTCACTKNAVQTHDVLASGNLYLWLAPLPMQQNGTMRWASMILVRKVGFGRVAFNDGLLDKIKRAWALLDCQAGLQ